MKYSLAAAFLLTSLATVVADSGQANSDTGKNGTKTTWFESYKRFKRSLKKDLGTEYRILVNYQGQMLINGPRREGKGKSSFSYDVRLRQRLWQGARATIRADGGAGRGLDNVVPTLLGFNDDAGDTRTILVSKYYIEQELADGRLRLIAGKVDLTDYFDANAVANDENTQFLSGGLVNNPIIPFPGRAISAIVEARPTDWFYVLAGVGDAQGQKPEMGTNTAFSDEDYSVIALEMGFTPEIAGRRGNYRILTWYDPQPQERFDGMEPKRDDVGFGISCDQQVTDRITLFARYGYGDEKVREIEHFWSFGGQLAGPFEARPDDVFGVGVAQAITSDDFRRVESKASTETVFETYYSYQVNDFVTLSPSVQVMLNPNAESGADCAVVGGIRAVIVF